MKRTFVMLPVFDALWSEAGLSDIHLKDLQAFLLENPKAGDVIPGLSGLRKLRWKLPFRGKRGSIRVFYLDIESIEALFLLTLLLKNERADLSPLEERLIRKLIKDLKAAYRRTDDA